MIESILAKLGTLGSGLDSDYADRLNFRYTSLGLITLGVLVTTRQFVGEAIVCWSPNNFNGQWIKYSDAYCWVTNTFYAPLDSHHNPKIDKYDHVELQYYQWVPIILFLQALFFMLPHILWRSIYLYAGFDFEQVTQHASSFQVQIDEMAWSTLITRLSRHIDRYLELQKSAGDTWCSKLRSILSGRCIVSISRHYGNFLTYTYPAVKALFILNIVGQMFVLSLWLGEGYRWYGFDIMFSMIMEGKRLSDVTTLFPRVTWCRVQERGKESILTHNMNCVLPVNLFNEMVFLVVWFWLAFVFVVTSINLTRWFLNCSYMGDEYVRKHLKFANKLQTPEDKKLLKRFLHGYLKQDGVFIIRMLSRNTTSIFISDLLSEMFELHRIKITEQRKQQRLERARIEAGIPTPAPAPPTAPNTIDSYHSEENLLFQPEPPNNSHAPVLPPRNITAAIVNDSKPPPLYQRFATNLDVTSTRSCEDICDKKK